MSIEVHNLSGAPLGLEANGQSYTLPNGSSELFVPDGSSYSLNFDPAGGGPPPPPSTNTFTEYGTLTIWEDSFQFEPDEAPLYYFAEGMILGVFVFGTAYVFRIVKNLAKQSPEV